METKIKSEVANQVLAYLHLKNHFVTWNFYQADRFTQPEGLETLKAVIDKRHVCIAVKSAKEKYLINHLQKLQAKVERTGGVFVAVRTLNEFKEWYHKYGQN